MADYYRILSAAIENQELSSDEDRQALYARAKTALEAQFASMDQELVADMIKSHQQNFDDAVAKIEQEIGAESEKLSPADESREIDSGSPEETDSVAVSEASSSSPDSVPDIVLPEAVENTSPDVVKPEIKPDKKIEPSVAETVKTEPAATPSVIASSSALHSSSSSPADGSQPSEAKSTAYVAPSTRVEPNLKTAPDLAAVAHRPLKAGMRPDGKKRSTGAIVFAVLFLLIASASAFGLWQRELVRDYSDQLGVMSGLWGQSDPAMTVQNTEPASENETDSQADTSNNTAAVEPEVVTPEAPSTQTPVAAMPDPVSDSGRVGESAPIPSATSEDLPSDTPPASATTQSAATPTQTDTQTAQNAGEAGSQPTSQDTPSTAPVELPLRAFFLIEKTTGGADPDDRYSGGAIWKFDASTNMLHIDTYFPRRKTELNIEILANSDTSFPASHTVTYRHNSLDEKPDGSIINFPALMVRADAGSEGEPLKGAGALIVPDKYILGLSENPENVSYNLNLVNKAKWLVVPVVFEIDNRRALFVIEKGPQGAREFANALAAWGQSELLSE